MKAETMKAEISVFTFHNSSFGNSVSLFQRPVKKELGTRAMRRQATDTEGTFTLREPEEVYRDVFAAENDALRLNNPPV
jgi:hypothetical protein